MPLLPIDIHHDIMHDIGNMKFPKGGVPDMPMTAKELLEKGAESIDAHGWCQNELKSNDGRMCAMGHLYHSADWINTEDGTFNNELGKATNLLSDAIGEFMDRPPLVEGKPWRKGDLHWPVPVWNDAPFTTEEDVKLVFKRAVELADE